MTDEVKNHDESFQDGMALLQKAAVLFSALDSSHANAISLALQGTYLIAQMVHTKSNK